MAAAHHRQPVPAGDRLQLEAENRPPVGTGDTPVQFREPEENRVWEALQALAEDYRLPIYLFYFQELPTQEIAKILAIRPGAVRMRLTRGREQLREKLKGEIFDE